ncbi:MAG: hypothetical protein HC773_31635 [Scytonema sp. CRU_2_7]|nr:hypothetical protein [Scytonema sp. CRU_2_7]
MEEIEIRHKVAIAERLVMKLLTNLLRMLSLNYQVKIYTLKCVKMDHSI